MLGTVIGRVKNADFSVSQRERQQHQQIGEQVAERRCRVPTASVLSCRISLNGSMSCSDISCTPRTTSCTTKTNRKIAVTWKKSPRLTRWP